MKKKSKIILISIFCIVLLMLFQKNVTTQEISTNIYSLQSANDSKTILLVAAHGAGKDCNHASTTINGTTYYENKEAREMIDLIAQYFDDHNVKYEIANQIVGDSYWSNDTSERDTARSCTNPNNSTCCGYRTATIGSYANILAAHVDSMGGNNYYSMVFELHFNGGGGDYSLVMGRDYNLQNNGKLIAQSVVNSTGVGKAIYGIDKEYVGINLGTLTIYYEQRQIPTYYLETVFMDNANQFQAYLNNKEKVAENIAKKLIDIAPNSVGGGGNQFVNTGSGGVLGGLTYDPYSEYYMNLTLIGDNDYSCTNIFLNKEGELNDLGAFLKDIYFLIKISAVIFLIVFGTIDLLKYLINDNNRKKALTNILKRLIIALIIFFLPDIIDLIFHLFGLYDLSSCGIS